jgi:phospholipid/cholesterol/gamma-HCH transport system substrate-binding protein
MIEKEDRRFRHLGRKIILFIVVAMIMVTGVFILIGNEQDLFTKKYELQITVDKGTGFSKGMPVKLSGFRIGRVSRISLNDAAKVDVVLQIDRSYQKWIRGDSRAKLVKEGLVGDMIIDLSVGSPAAPPLNDQSRLAFEKTMGLDELVSEVTDKVKPVMIQMQDIINYVNDPKGDLKQSIRNFNLLSAHLDEIRNHADQLLTTGRDAVRSSTKRVDGVLIEADSRLKEVKPVLARVDRISANLEQRLPPLLAKADGTVANLLEISNTTAATSSSIMPRVPMLVDKVERAIDQSNRLLDGVSGMWPFRNAMPAPVQDRLVPGDSHE